MSANCKFLQLCILSSVCTRKYVSHNYLMQNKIHNQGIKEWDTEQAMALLLRSPVI